LFIWDSEKVEIQYEDVSFSEECKQRQNSISQVIKNNTGINTSHMEKDISNFNKNDLFEFVIDSNSKCIKDLKIENAYLNKLQVSKNGKFFYFEVNGDTEDDEKLSAVFVKKINDGNRYFGFSSKHHCLIFCLLHYQFDYFFFHYQT